MADKKAFLLTYYIKNKDDRTNSVFDIIPYRTLALSMSEERVVKLIESEMKRYPFLKCCSVMDKTWLGDKEYHLRFTATNPLYSDVPIPRDYKLTELEAENKDDSYNQVYMTPYDIAHQGFEVKLDHEEKVIRLGSYFYALKGVLICESTEAERDMYYCHRYMTYPIVDNDWRVFEGREIVDGIEPLIIGKKGDTVPLIALKAAMDYNARHHDCELEAQLLDLERQGITISNRKGRHSTEELPDTLVIGIERRDKYHFMMKSHPDGYYIPERAFRVGDDDELYEYDRSDNMEKTWRLMSTVIADDVWGISWFFNKPKIRVLLTAIEENYVGFAPDKLGPIPNDWYYTVQTLEGEINSKLDKMHQEYPDDYNRRKRPDVVEENEN